MSRIDELIAKHCPNGVEHLPFTAVGKFSRGGGPQKKDFQDSGVGCIHYGQIYTHYGTAANIANKFVSEDVASKSRQAQPGDVIIAVTGENDDDLARGVAWLGSQPVAVSNHTLIFSSDLDPRYVSYFLRSSSFDKEKRRHIMGTKVRSISAGAFEKILIPVPPLEVQRGIVEVLDTFSKLEAELEAELEARKQQYEHYRSELFAYSPESVPFKTFTEVGTFRRGGGPQKKDFIDSGIGCIHYGQIYTHYGVSASATNKFVDDLVASKAKCADSGDVIIAVTSENDDDLARSVAWLGEGPVAVSNHTLIFKSEMDPRFISYYLRTRQFDIAKRKYISGTKVRSLPLRAFENIQIPVPSIQEQRRLADTLDKFDALVNDLSVGLPAELAARRQQYEYYRDKLLTFKELEVTA